MSIHRLGSATFPAAIPQDPTPQRRQPASMAGAGLPGGLSELPHRPPASAPPGALGELPPDLLGEVLQRAADFNGPPREVARWLANLKPLSKAFHACADAVLQTYQAHREAVVNTVTHAIKDAEDEWARSGWAPADKERIEACFAAALRNLDLVIVDLDRIGSPLKPGDPMDWPRFDRSPQMVKLVTDALATHSGLRALEVTAMENQQLSCMAGLVGGRPELLRSLTVKTAPNRRRIAEALHCRAELSRVLPKQENLSTLKLEDSRDGMSGRATLNLQEAGLDKAIALLPSLSSLSLSHYELTMDGANALAGVLRRRPTLENLDLSHCLLGAEAFTRVASSLSALPRLRSLSLEGTPLTRGSAGRLAGVFSHLAELQTLNLASTKMVLADVEQLAGGLAGLRQLQTLDVSYNQLDQDGRAGLIAALADVPTLRHLYLRALWHQNPPNLDTLKDDLAPLAGNQELHVYLHRLSPYDPKSEPRMAQVQAEIPRLHFIE